MYASIWRFTGDPDELVRSYDAMLADIPSASMRLHLCLRTPNGIVILDTCPSHEAFEQFATGPFPALRSLDAGSAVRDVCGGSASRSAGVAVGPERARRRRAAPRADRQSSAALSPV